MKLVLPALMLALLLFSSCQDKKPVINPATMPIPVTLYEIQPMNITYYDEFPGTVVAFSQVDLHAEVTGYITGIYFKEGEKVHKGQKLYDIDKSLYMAGYEQGLSTVKVAESNLEQAQKDADRYKYLDKHDAIAKQVLDHAVTTLENAKNQVNAAKQDLAKAQANLSYAVISAPFDGTIGLSQVKLGTLVNAGQTVLNTISSDNPIGADFIVNEKQISRFIKLQKQGVKAGDSIFSLLTPDNATYKHTGEIFAIDRGVDPLTGSIKIRLSFPNPDMELRAGMSCKVRVHNQDTSRQIVIPSKAIVEQMGEYFVYVAKDTTIKQDPKAQNTTPPGVPAPHLKALQKKIMPGQVVGANTIVKGGLEPGEKLVTEGVQKLHDGSLMVLGGKPAGGHPAPK